jgi:magnesium chelatase subunit D
VKARRAPADHADHTAHAAPAVPGRCGYPFAALVGQERVRTALLLGAVDRGLGGVLLRGEKGTGKSTAVRALADLLPGGEDLRTLPLSATEDRLVGGVDLERTLARGRAVLSPGLLARVHGGVLYVDEINLLDDHLAQVLLTVAGSGRVRVEREGFSRVFPSEFLLVGTMNPEEGYLRPQLLDRFGLCVDVEGETDPQARVELLRRCSEHEADPVGFVRRWQDENERLARRILRARQLLPQGRLSGQVRPYVAELCRTRRVAGHRADLVLERAASAHAAWRGRTRVEIDDVLAVAEFALAHRGRHAVPPPPAPAPPPSPSPRSSNNDSNDDSNDAPQKEPREANADGRERPDGPSGGAAARDRTGAGDRSGATGPDETTESDATTGPDGETVPDGGNGSDGPTSPGGEQVFAAGDPFAVRRLPVREDRGARARPGRRLRARSTDRTGRRVGSRPADDAHDLALDATLRAAAPHQHRRRPEGTDRLVVHRADWREKIRRRRSGTLVLFVVDASGSMGVRGRMLASKGAVLSLLLDVYRNRDRVGLVTFRGREARLLLPPTCSIDVAGRLLRELPTGGRTPLADGLLLAHRTLQIALRRDPGLRPLAVVVTDGRGTWGLDGPCVPGEIPRVARPIAAEQRVRWVVVDTEDPRGVRLERARDLAGRLGAQVFRIEDLRADDLVALTRGNLS